MVSAPGKRDRTDTKVTDLLIEVVRAQLTNQDGHTALTRVIDRYAAIVGDLGLPDTALAPIVADFERRLAMSTSDEALYADAMKAGGEDNCARLVAEYLRHSGTEAHYLDPGEGGLILSEEPGNARVLQASYGKLRQLKDRPGITIFPGFFGYSTHGPGRHLLTRWLGHNRRDPRRGCRCDRVRKLHGCGPRSLWPIPRS